MSDFSVEHERSLVEGLRPRSDQSVLAAVFSTYSLDLLALLSVVLGLSGLDCSEMDADPIDLNRSLFVLNKRVVVLCQLGRIRAPKTAWRARVLSMLDRTIVEVPFDERQRSWHAKLALVAYGRKSGPRVATEWRLWIGSRNLTRSTDLDLGILLVGTPFQNGSSKQKKIGIPGLLSALEDLLKAGGEPVRRVLSFASRAPRNGLPSIYQLLDELLRNVQWDSPLGMSVEKISAHGHQNDVADVLKVSPPAKGASVLLGSPFVDHGGLDHLGRFIEIDVAKHATLVSTSAALDSLERAPGNLLLRSADQSPTQQIDTDPIQSDEDSPLESSDSDESPTGRGLHAKFVLVAGPDSPPKLFLGSANLTARGLKNINAEILVRLRISKVLARNFKQVLIRTLSQEYVKVPPDLEALAIEEARERLDATRRQLAAELDLSWDFAGAAILRASKAPSFDSNKMRLQVAPLARPEFSCLWSSGQTEISFGGLTPAERGQLVALTLTEIDTGEAMCWLQKASNVEEEQLQRRDDALAAELLSLRNILQIIQAELAGTPPARGMPWHVRSYKSKGRMEHEVFGDLKLEDLLRSRARDAEWSRDFVTRIGNTLETLLQTSDTDERPDVAAFLHFWKPFAAAFGGTT